MREIEKRRGGLLYSLCGLLKSYDKESGRGKKAGRLRTFCLSVLSPKPLDYIIQIFIQTKIISIRVGEYPFFK